MKKYTRYMCANSKCSNTVRNGEKIWSFHTEDDVYLFCSKKCLTAWQSWYDAYLSKWHKKHEITRTGLGKLIDDTMRNFQKEKYTKITKRLQGANNAGN